MAGKKRTADQPEERSGVAVSADTGLSTGDFTSPPGVSAGPQVVEQPGETIAQDAQLGQQSGDAALSPDAALQPMAGAKGAAGEDEVEALFVRSVPDSFRRCGHRFTREGHGIALSLLSDAQVDALLNDPNLVVEHCSFALKDVS